MDWVFNGPTLVFLGVQLVKFFSLYGLERCSNTKSRKMVLFARISYVIIGAIVISILYKRYNRKQTAWLLSLLPLIEVVILLNLMLGEHLEKHKEVLWF